MFNPLWCSLDVTVALAYTFLAIKCSDATMHAVTFGIAIGCVCGFMGMMKTTGVPPWAHWKNWFGGVKRISLGIGWLAFLGLWRAFSTTEGKWRVWASRFAQFVLMANVLQAGILMLLSGNYVAGSLCILLSLFAPKWDQMNADGQVICAPDCPILFCIPCFKFTSRWYFRSYYVILSLCLCFDPLFKKTWMFVYISCLWPLFYQELIGPNENEGAVFKIRAFMLISQAVLMDVFIYDGAQKFSTPVTFPTIENLWVVNGASAGILAFFLLFFCILDKVRPPADAVPQQVVKDADQEGIETQF